MGRLTKKLKSQLVFIVALALIMAVLAGYNIYLVLANRQAAIKMAEQQEELEEEKARLEELKKGIAGELAEYYPGYRVIKDEFTGNAEKLSGELEGEIVNIAQLKEITSARLDAAIDYRDKFTASGIPGPLEAFYEYELEFIESDIETIKEVLLYYGSDSYSTYDVTAIGELYRKTGLLCQKAQEELKSTYSRYELGYLLE